MIFVYLYFKIFFIITLCRDWRKQDQGVPGPPPPLRAKLWHIYIGPNKCVLIYIHVFIYLCRQRCTDLYMYLSTLVYMYAWMHVYMYMCFYHLYACMKICMKVEVFSQKTELEFCWETSFCQFQTWLLPGLRKMFTSIISNTKWCHSVGLSCNFIRTCLFCFVGRCYCHCYLPNLAVVIAIFC